MPENNPNIVVGITASDPVEYKTIYKATAEVFRVCPPSSEVNSMILNAIDEFLIAFPEQKWRFYGKGTVKKLKRLGQIIDDVPYGEITSNESLMTSLNAIVGLI